MKQFPIHWQGDNLVMIIGSDTIIANKNTHPRFSELVDAIKARNWDAAAEAALNKHTPINFKDGEVEVRDDVAYYAGRKLPEGISKMLKRLLTEGFPHEYFVLFINNLMQNSSFRSVNQLYDFLTLNDMPITEDGCFMAYKAVDDGYWSSHCDAETGEKVRYEVGDVPTMPRHLISDDPEYLCHAGLHACSMKYLESWSGKHLMLVKINPRDVVCVPNDCNRTKMRVCRMEVVSEVLNEHGQPWYEGRRSSLQQYDVLSHNPKQYDDDYLNGVRSGLSPEEVCGFCDQPPHSCECYNNDDDAGDDMTYHPTDSWDGCDD